jgi:CDP-glycerol glycerophosphotransferase (TagB/SpsB family)
MAGEKKRTVLYAPTWEGFYQESCYCSLVKMGAGIVEVLAARADTYRLDYKGHPLTGFCEAEYLVAQDRVIAAVEGSPVKGVVMAPEKTLYDYFLDADLLIADVSSVVSDFLYLGRPIVLTNPLGFEPMTERFPVAECCYVLENPTEELPGILDDAFGGDSLKAARDAKRTYVLGPPDENPVESFRRTIDSLVAEGQQRRLQNDPILNATECLNETISTALGKLT